MDRVWDSLPGVFSWEAFNSFFTLIAYQTQRRGGGLSLLMVGLEDSIELGEASEANPEEALFRTVAASLLQVCRGGDMIARYGPRSLAILAQDAQEAGARRLVERIRRALPEQFSGVEPPVSLRFLVGMATLPQHGTAVDQLVDHAQATAAQSVSLLRGMGATLAPRPGTSRAELPPAGRVSSGERDRLAAQRRTALDYLVKGFELGLFKGIAIQTQTSPCPVCLDAARDVYVPALMPPLPLAGCTGPAGCRCTYTAPGLDALHRTAAESETPRRLRNAAAFGADPRRGPRPEEVAEFLDAYPLESFRIDLVLQQGETVYLSHPARRAVELSERPADLVHGVQIPVDQSLLTWLGQADLRVPALPSNITPAKEDGDIFVTSQRVVYRTRDRRVVDNAPLVDVMAIELLRDAIALTLAGRTARLVYVLRDALPVALYLARALRLAAFSV